MRFYLGTEEVANLITEILVATGSEFYIELVDGEFELVLITDN